MLDIALFRDDKGGNSEAVRESQRRRHAPVEWVDEVIALDKEWIRLRYETDQLNKKMGALQKQIGEKKKVLGFFLGTFGFALLADLMRFSCSSFVEQGAL